jgi:hypothetical protein
MPAKTKQTKNTPNTAPVETPVETPVAASVETPVAASVAASVEQKTGGKTKGPAKNKKVAEPVVVEPVVVAKPAAEPPVQKAGGKGKAPAKKNAKAESTSAETSAEPVENTANNTKKPNARKAKAKAVPVDGEVATESVAKPKKAAQKKSKVSDTTEEPQETQDGGENASSNEKLIRSFKVLLPDKAEYEGRFTGLTPYQAANKALSKYFRENKDVESIANTITFQICESTRKSNKHEYKYTGSRVKLEVPVSYTLTDGKVISKHFKNILKKVKKAEPVAAPATA